MMEIDLATHKVAHLRGVTSKIQTHEVPLLQALRIPLLEINRFLKATREGIE